MGNPTYIELACMIEDSSGSVCTDYLHIKKHGKSWRVGIPEEYHYIEFKADPSDRWMDVAIRVLERLKSRGR